MAIYTPRGLKIRLSIQYCFTLLARLYPEVDPYTVLKTTEGLEFIPSFLAVLASLICFLYKI